MTVENEGMDLNQEAEELENQATETEAAEENAHRESEKANSFANGDQEEENSKEEQHKPAGQKSAEQAAQRRAREREAAVQAEVQRQMDAFYAKQYAGKTGKDGKPITTAAQAEAYEAELASTETVKALMDNGFDEGMAKRMAGAMARLNELENAETARRKVAEAQQQIEQEEYAQKMMEASLAELKKAYPSCGIKTVNDLLDGTHDDLCNLAAKMDGSLLRAYRDLHFDEIAGAGAAAARQQAINVARGGTEHLHGIKSSGGNTDLGMTEQDYANYAAFGFSREAAEKAFRKLYGK